MQFWQFSAATDVGLQRNNNEDSYLSCPDLGLWIVADGMGGHAAGEVASAIVSSTIKDQVSQGANLNDAIQMSHREVLNAAANGQGSHGMGSTVVALSTNGEQYQVSWVGDSRAYLWSPNAEVKLSQITTDHSYVQMLFQTGAISEEELETHPEKNIITQCLGSMELDNVTVDSVEGEWQKGDWIILCSDGLSDAVPNAQIADILNNANNINSATNDLIAMSLARGGKDNITVSVIQSPTPIRDFFRFFSHSISKFFS